MAITVVPRQRNTGLQDLLGILNTYRAFEQMNRRTGMEEVEKGRQLGRPDIVESGMGRLGHGPSLLNMITFGKYGDPGFKMTRINDPLAQRRAYEQQQEAVGAYKNMISGVNRLQQEENKLARMEKPSTRTGSARSLNRVLAQDARVQDLREKIGNKIEAGVGAFDKPIGKTIRGDTYHSQRKNLFKDTMKTIKGKGMAERNKILFESSEAQARLDDLWGRRRPRVDQYQKMMFSSRGRGRGGVKSKIWTFQHPALGWKTVTAPSPEDVYKQYGDVRYLKEASKGTPLADVNIQQARLKVLEKFQTASNKGREAMINSGIMKGLGFKTSKEAASWFKRMVSYLPMMGSYGEPKYKIKNQPAGSAITRQLDFGDNR